MNFATQLSLLVLLVVTPGCSSGDAASSGAAASASASSAASPASAASSAATPPPPTSAAAFDNAEHGFGLELPAGWEITGDEDRKAREALAVERAKDPKAMKALLARERQLIAAQRRRGEQIVRLSARYAANTKPKAYLDGYLKTLRSGLSDDDIKVSGRANVQMGGRPFTTVRLILVEPGVQQLLFVTESKGGTLLFLFSAKSAPELNEMGRLFKTISFDKTSP